MLTVAVLALLCFTRALVSWARLSRDGEEDYNYRLQEGMIGSQISKDTYLRAYRRFHAPRAAIYMTAALVAMLVLTFPALWVLQWLLEQVWVLSGRSQDYHPGFLVWKFYIFLGMIALWVGIVFFAARAYYSNIMISFDKELDREMAAQET